MSNKLTISNDKLYNLASQRFEYLEKEKGLIYKTWFNGLPLDKVGHANIKGYRILRIEGTSYREHQIVWLLHNRELVVGDKNRCIDHINRDTGDNRISNLRVVSQRENSRNRVNQKHSNITASGNYQAYINFGSDRVRLGTFLTEKFARSVLDKLAYMGETKENSLKLKNMGVRTNTDKEFTYAM